jgi:lantibiotic biosynthesis protein
MTVAAQATWRAIACEHTARRAREVARDVALRLREGHAVEAAAARAAAQSANPATREWEPCGVAQGFAGLALLAGSMDECFPGESWDVVAHAHLERAARAATAPDAPTGIFSGLSGVAFATARLSRHGTRYRRFADLLDAELLPRVHALAAAAPHDEPTGVAYFDIISGLSGVGASLLDGAHEPARGAALRAVLGRLVALCEDDEDGRPRWWTPAELLHPHSRVGCPYGNLNCGLAHGIPGPLALMALALLQGVRVPGLEDAVTRTASWLCGHRADDGWGINWPYAVPLDETRREDANAATGACPEAMPSRTAWCYGAPGVSRALLLAGRALDRADYAELALDAMRAAISKPFAEREIASPTFCHGLAGLLQITLRFAQDEPDPEFAIAAEEMCRQLIDLHDDDSPLGYRSVEAADRAVDDPGLLDGAAGVALVLLAASTDVEPSWDRVFLLS